ncbi:unnamed protein product [Brachionus calyciflorus]|uniref:MARVEL domain-containing protein n=1 Tax=Brachionus calyciflorus TaxID=104777 RepID=A0A813XYM9_9BILA|nr:unnamed protein product [Brachionus calyciflorus]
MFIKKFIPKILLNYDKEYMFIRLGFVRLFIILMLLGGWIAATAAPTNNDIDTKAPKVAYLIFGIIGFLVSIFIFIFNFYNIIKMDIFVDIPWEIIFLGLDFVFMCALFGTSIGCSAAEANSRDKVIRKTVNGTSTQIITYDEVNKGTFATAAVFGFLASISYFILVCISVNRFLKIRKKNKQQNSPST